MMSGQVLDARGLICPLPVIRTQDRIAGMFEGDELEVWCTDPGVLHDIPAWCRIHGHTMGQVEEDEDGLIRIQVIVGSTEAP